MLLEHTTPKYSLDCWRKASGGGIPGGVDGLGKELPWGGMVFLIGSSIDSTALWNMCLDECLQGFLHLSQITYHLGPHCGGFEIITTYNIDFFASS